MVIIVVEEPENFHLIPIFCFCLTSNLFFLTHFYFLFFFFLESRRKGIIADRDIWVLSPIPRDIRQVLSPSSFRVSRIYLMKSVLFNHEWTSKWLWGFFKRQIHEPQSRPGGFVCPGVDLAMYILKTSPRNSDRLSKLLIWSTDTCL